MLLKGICQTYINVFYFYYLDQLWKLYSDRVTTVLNYLGHLSPSKVINRHSQQFRLIKTYPLWQDVACQLETTKRNTILYGKPVNDLSAESLHKINLVEKLLFLSTHIFPPPQKKYYKKSFAKRWLNNYLSTGHTSGAIASR